MTTTDQWNHDQALELVAERQRVALMLEQEDEQWVTYHLKIRLNDLDHRIKTYRAS